MGIRAGLVAVGVAALVVGGFVVATRPGAPEPPRAAPTASTASPSPSAGAPAAPTPAGPLVVTVVEDPQETAEPPVIVVEDYAELDPVPLDEPAEDGRLRVELATVSRVHGEGKGVGERSGPAILVELEVRNTSEEDVTLDFAVANLYGPDGAPGPLLSADPRSEHLKGVLAAGATARGTYVFRAPSQEGPVKVTLSHEAQTPAVAFLGEVN